MAMSSQLTLSILTPDRSVARSEKVDFILLTTTEGRIEILPGHTPLVGMLEPGLFKYRGSSGTEKSGFISSGFLDVQQNIVTVLAETLEFKAEIDVARAKSAEERARQKLTSGTLGGGEDNFRKQQLKLQRALIRQQLAKH